MDSLTPYTVRAHNIDPTVENKIHDDEVARRFGFDGALVPGVEVFAYAVHPFAAAWGESFLSGGGIAVRFRRPVYDGDRVHVTADPDGTTGAYALSVTGPDGVVRCAGQAWRRDPDDAPVSVADYSDLATPLPPLPPAGPETLAPGRALATVEEPATQEAHDRYLDGIAEQLPLHREGAVHPGALLRMANALLVRNVALGPWIHTASACRLLGVARVPTTLSARGRVVDRYDRDGRSWVRYDALVLADGHPVMQVDHTAIYALG